MTIKHIRIFLAVCECGNSVSAAAKKLYTTQPSVTIAIQELEQHFGTLLFDRISRRLYLTEAGKEFLNYAQRISGLFDDMEKGLRDWDSVGLLRVGASVTIGSQFMPAYVEAFNELHPGAKVHVQIGPSRILEQKLMTNELDLALVEIPVHDRNLHAEVYMEDYLQAIAPARSPFWQGQVLTLAELKEQNVLLREPGSGTREIFDQTTQQAGVKVEPIWEGTSTTALINAVIHGVGITIAPRRMVRDCLERGLVYGIGVEGLTFGQQFYIVYHKDKHLTRLIQDFIRICTYYEMDYPLPQNVEE